MVDRNEVQGRELIRLGKCSQQVVSLAYQAAKQFPNADLCDYLVRQGQISLVDADFVRRSSSAISQSPNSQSGNSRPPTVVDFPSMSAPNRSSPSSSMQTGSSQSKALKDLRRLGDYEILEEIAQGGMGAVYLVQSVSLKAKFALKTLLAGQLAGSEALERFMLEAETTARLNHPNIVRIHHIGEDQGFYYLVMDYIEGPTLKEMVANESLSEKDCAGLIEKLAKALSYAHSHAILHRDIKPANVLVRRSDGEPLLTDFGLAKDISNKEDGLTMSGQAIGTPEYMSPEQADGDLELIDRRSDVYSLGATLYELLAKKPPFQGSTKTNILKAVMLNEPESPKKARPRLSTDLETICMKCLEKDPAQRYATALALAEDLQRFLADEAILARPPSVTERLRRWRRRNSTTLQIVMTVVLTSALILGFLGFRQYRDGQRQAALQSSLKEALDRSHGAVRNAPELLFKTWDERLSVLDSDIETDQGQAILVSYETELAVLASELKEESLRAQAVKLFQSNWEAATQGLEKERGAVPSLNSLEIQSFISSPLWAEVEAHRQCTLAHIFEQRGEKKKAEFARTRAYQVSPQSQYGNEALLDAAELILEEERFVVADQLFARIVRQPSPYLQGRAYYGRARVALWRQQSMKTLNYIKEIEKLRRINKRLAAEMTKEKLLWLRQIASRFGRAQGSTQVNGKALIANLPGKAPIFREVVEETKLQFYYGVWKNRKVELEKGPFLELPGVFARQAQWQQGERSIWAIQYSDSRGNRLAFYEWNGQTVNRLNWPVVVLQPFYRLRHVGDFDGNGDLDLVIDCPFGAKSNERTQLRVLLNVHSSRSQSILLKETIGSVLYCTNLADLDGDGKQEIVVGVGEWNHFCVLVFKLANNAAGYLPPFKRLLGVVVSANVRRDESRERDEVVLSVSRHRDFDIKTIFNDDLSPELPNAIWRLTENDAGYQLKLSASTPFERRNRSKLSSPMFLRSLAPDFPGSYVFLELGARRGATFNFVPGPESKNLPTLLAKAPRNSNRHYQFSIHDIDGDGDGELFFGTYKHEHYLYGLKDAEVVEKAEFDENQEAIKGGKIEEDAIEVALNLLDLGQASEARKAIERYCKARELTTTQWVNAQKYLAMSWAQEDNHEMAKRVCLKAWAVAPRQSFDLVIEAAEYACHLNDYSEAIQIIENIPNFIQLNTEQALRFRRMKQRVGIVAGMSTIVRIDKKTLQSGDLPFSIRKPWFFKWTEDGFSVRVQKMAGPLLTLPINNRGGPIRIKASVRVPFLEFGERINFGLEVSNEVKSLVFVRMEERGGGDVNSLQRTLRFFSQLGDSPYGTRTKLTAFSRYHDILFDGLYDAEDRSLNSRLIYGGKEFTQATATQWRFNSGRGRIFLGYNGAQKVTVGANPGHSFLELRSLSIDANRKYLSVLNRDPKDVLGEAGYLFFLGQFKETEGLLKKKIDLGSMSRASAEWVEAYFLLALAQCRMGQPEKALQTFKEVHKRSEQGFKELWGRALCVLTNSEIHLLAQVVWGEQSENELFKLIGSHKLDKDLPTRFLAGIRTRHAKTLVMAQLYMSVGAYDRALDCAKRFVGKSRGMGRYIAGRAAYNAGRYKECAVYWEPLKESQDFMNSLGGRGATLTRLLKRAKIIIEHGENGRKGAARD